MALPRDTSPEVEAFLVEGYRRMSLGRKAAIVCGLIEATRQLALADIRRRHPAIGEREALLRLASRTIDAETMRRAFDWDPEQQGY